MPEFCSRDVVAVAVELVRANAGDLMRVVVCSAYFPHEEENLLPPGPLDRLIRHCQKDGLPLIVGCDANAHHAVWGSTDINNRGRKLLEYLVATDLEILNRGGEPTFQTAVRSEVLDLTFCSRSLVGSVVDWRVSQEPSLSDHKQIVFGLANMKPEVIRCRNPRKTTFGQQLAKNLEGFPRRPLEGFLMKSSYEASCPEKTVGSNRKVSWWGPELQNLRAEARRAWNRARNTGRQSDWNLYRRSQKAYRDSILQVTLPN
ncbi:lian-aa1 retrotransposon protein [Lasius niger]|uniref:Lian-aa1 retrotransposon protein n=1 Tax=Lasius niger TaxID=67767 RepID=A0A0J7JVW6_LASNI|nr:lian-aa1 retrotransposon protein [Lasius niger]